MPKLIVDGEPITFEPSDSALVALLRSDKHPTGGGCLCCAGDCPHCVATVDGVAYVRTCQVEARPGMLIERHHNTQVHPGGYPPLPYEDKRSAEIPARNLHCDVVVIGQGVSGKEAAEAARASGKNVITLDVGERQEVIGIYPGPLVVARTHEGMLHIHPHDEIVVATGAAEIQPVAEGNRLMGLVTARAASLLARTGLDLGKVVALGTPPTGLEVQQAEGDLLRFEGEEKVDAVVIIDANGEAERLECDTVSLGLGFHPRDALVRMGNGLNVRAVGDCAKPSDIPPCPASGTLCHCSGVKVADMDFIWERGFHELELVKRATLAGTGTCQGSACLPHIRSFLADRGEALQAPFTARPLTKQVTMGEIAAGSQHRATPRTALHDEHLKLGAQMERIGGWWRPWNYGNTLEEYWAVREAVSLGDVSTLGKMQGSGPDAVKLLERLYPTQVASIKQGRSRYALLLDERGYVVEDGLICKDSDTRYTLTFTSGGSSFAELWLRDWAEGWKLDVRLMNQTMSLGAINVTGPLATDLLERTGLSERLRYMQHTEAEVAGVPCKVVRLSFTGELSYELHHPAGRSVELWRALMDLGKDLGVKPHGLEALQKLRLEKGHIIVGQDTDFDSTPRRIVHEWAINLRKDEFIGRQAVLRTNKIPLDRQLVGLEIAGDAPFEGALLYRDSKYAGYVTSSTYSPVLGKSVMLAWLELFDGALPEEVTVDGRTARRVELPFYDPEGSRARV